MRNGWLSILQRRKKTLTDMYLRKSPITMRAIAVRPFWLSRSLAFLAYANSFSWLVKVVVRARPFAYQITLARVLLPKVYKRNLRTLENQLVSPCASPLLDWLKRPFSFTLTPLFSTFQFRQSRIILSLDTFGKLTEKHINTIRPSHRFFGQDGPK